MLRLNLILDKQTSSATERVISQMTDSNRGNHIWYCDRCETSTTKPKLDGYCKCGTKLRFLKYDDKNEQYKR